jgi:uncharacterized membrane protein YtjA (UPF0391 family)
MKFIPTRVHGILDYSVGAVLMMAPNIFGFDHLNGPAVWVPRVIGVLSILQSLITRYELGIIKQLPMRMHLTVDYAAGLLLAASPWIFRFYDSANQRFWVPHFLVGIAIFLVTLFTETEPRTARDRRETHAPA